jgi:hypothetical protein
MNHRNTLFAVVFAILSTTALVAQEEGKITESRLDAIGPNDQALGP